MRLIDADNLKPTEGMFIYQTEDRDTVIATEAYRWELIKREAPTIKAIPIEWIKNYIQKLETILKDNLDLGEDGPTCEIVTIEDMLERWENENETN